MNLYDSIKYIYPNLSDELFEIRAIKGISFIHKWNTSYLQPTETELQTAWNYIEVNRKASEDKALIKAELKNQKEIISQEILAKASISDQLNLIAWTLDVLVDVLSDDYPIILEHPYVIASRIKLNEIKAILNK